MNFGIGLTHTRRIATIDVQATDLQAAMPGTGNEPVPSATLPPKSKKAPLPFHLTNHLSGDDSGHRQAELFYLQKQIQTQTPMVIVLADGEHIEGCIEWY